jgi:hypothetical protein
MPHPRATAAGRRYHDAQFASEAVGTPNAATRNMRGSCARARWSARL